jgi:hypothetical protein
MRALSLLLLALVGCGASWDPTANTVGAQIEARQLERCATDDAGTCTAAFMRVTAATAYCANAQELAHHGAPVPEAGTTCPKKP